MSIGPLWQMFNQQPGRTDAELAANMMRMVALWPLVREEIGMGKVEQAMKILQASGIEPGSEAYAQQHEQQIGPLVERYNLGKRGIPGRIPFTRLVGGEEFQQRFPEQYGRLSQQIAAMAEPFLVTASPETRERIMKSLMAQVESNQLPMRVMPDGTFQMDAAAVQRQMQSILPTALQTVANLPQTTTLGKYVEINHPDLYKRYKDHPTMALYFGTPVDEREPQRALGPFITALHQNAEALIASAQMAVNVMKVDPSPGSLAKATQAINAIESAAQLNPSLRTAMTALLATAQGYRNQAQRVVMPDGKETYMNGIEAQTYINNRAKFLIDTQVAPVASALAQNPMDVSMRKQKDAILAQAVKEGLPLQPVFQAMYGDKVNEQRLLRLEIATRSQNLANARTRGSVDGLALKFEQAKLDALQEAQEKGLWGISEVGRHLLGVRDGQPLDLKDWAAFQQLHAQNWSEGLEAFQRAYHPQDVRKYFARVAVNFRRDLAFNNVGLRGQTKEAAVESYRTGLDSVLEEVIPLMVKRVQDRSLPPVQAQQLMQDYRDAIQGGLRRGVLDRGFAQKHLQGLQAVERAINQPPDTSFWGEIRRLLPPGWHPSAGPYGQRR